MVHEYKTKTVLGKDLDRSMVLVGRSGGLCAIYQKPKSGLVLSLLHMETEHGFLIIDDREEYQVIDND